MRFAFTADQLELRDGLRDLLAKECSPAHVRDAWANATGRVPGLWDRLVEVGVVGMLAPESAGGLGLTFADLVLLLEETGRHAVPEPIVETAAFGVPLLGRADLTVAAAHEFVPWADTADVVVTAAGRFDPPFPVHHYLLGAGKYGVTQLRNLDRLPPVGSVVVVAPLPIVGGTGSPARVLALVPR
jgi:hypothetical protein